MTQQVKLPPKILASHTGVPERSKQWSKWTTVTYMGNLHGVLGTLLKPDQPRFNSH